jgi:hypothetical protein
MRLSSRLIGSGDGNGCSCAHPDATPIAHTKSKQLDREFLIAFCIHIAAVLIAILTIMERALRIAFPGYRPWIVSATKST